MKLCLGMHIATNHLRNFHSLTKTSHPRIQYKFYTFSMTNNDKTNVCCRHIRFIVNENKKHQNNGKKKHKKINVCPRKCKKNIRSKRQVIHGMGELLPTRPVQKCCPRPCCHIGYQDLICSSPCAFSTVVVPTQPFSKRKIWYLGHGTSRGSAKLSLNRAN